MTPYDYIAPELSYAARLFLVALHVACSSSCLYLWSHRAPGWSRAPIAVVCIFGNFLVPALFHPYDEILTSAVCGLSAMWLLSCKVFGWAINRGPLVEPLLSLPQFIAVAGLPITPVLRHQKPTANARQSEQGLSGLASAFNFIITLAALGGTVTLLQQPTLPRLFKEFLYAFGLYTFIAAVMNCISVFTITVLNLSIAPHFDRPYLSTSLQSFWSRRWNLNTGYTMRFTVYDPICEGRLIRKDDLEVKTTSTYLVSKTRRALAVCASFLLSALLHEVFIIYLRGQISGYWFAFFTIQGPLLVIESCFRRWLKSRGWVVPSLVALPLTMAVLLFWGDVLFFPDIVRMGIPDNVVENVKMGLEGWVQGTLGLL